MKMLLTIASLLSLGFGLWAGVDGKTAVLTCSFLAFALLLFAANLDRISDFKATGTGVEAKTREIMQRAEVTLNELQALAKHVGAISLSLVKRSGRIGGYSDAEEAEIKRSVLHVLNKVGIQESEFPEILNEWHKYIDLDYAHYILGGNIIPKDAESEVVKEFKQLRSGGFIKIPTPDDIKRFLESNGFITPELQELIKDYEHYLQFREHRRPEVWEQRVNWGRLKKT